MKKITLFALLVSSALTHLPVTARADLNSYSAPKDMKNLHIEALGSSETASEFIVFIRDEIKAHYHKTHTELVYVLEGTAIFHLGETKQLIKAGDFIRIDQGVIHSVKVTSKLPLKVLSIQTPKFVGKDRFFIKS